jgi:hypothetical protein
MPDAVLDRRALGRATLQRQLLLRRSELSTLAALEHLVGLQAQSPNAPYVGLWSRLEGFEPDDLARAILVRHATRVPLMRATIHLVTARDCLALQPLTQPVLARAFSSQAFARDLEGVDHAELVTAGHEVLQEPHTRTELGRLLAERWPDRDPASLALAVTYLLPVVQVPPRGVWGSTARARWTTMDSWLGGPDAPPDLSRDEVVIRYLAAFGPATIADVRTWSGFSGVRDVLERLRPRLRTFADDAGRELFDLPDAPRPDPETPAPPRFLPEYDNLLLSYADRSRVIAEEDRRRVFGKGALLVDGYVRGAWRISRHEHAATLVIEPFVSLAAGDADAVLDEGTALLDLVAEGTDARDVQLLPLATGSASASSVTRR